MKIHLSILLFFTISIGSLAVNDESQIIIEPVNPNATEEARQVYAILRMLYGEKIVSGTVANVNWNIKEAQNVYKWTRK